MTETYIAAFGGGVASRAGVRFAERLAALTGARVVAATTYSPPAPERRGRRRAQALLASLGEGGVDRAAVPAASPAAGLCTLAWSLGASAITVGAGHAVAAQLLEHPPCTVVVVPDPYAHPAVRTVTVAYDGRPESQVVLRWAAELAIGLSASLVAFAVRPDAEPAFAGAA
jgi:hypothetical protein